MTNEEAIEMLKAKLECITRDVSGRDDDCNRRLCGECRLNYEKGTMGEQKGYLRMSIEALERQPCYDAISRSDAINAMSNAIKRVFPKHRDIAEKTMNKLPPVIPQQKTGLWISAAIQGEIDGQIVKAFICSECGAISVFRMTDGKIVNGDLCANCGAKMQEVEE